MVIDYDRYDNDILGPFCVEAGKSVEIKVQASPDRDNSDRIRACLRILRDDQIVAESCEFDNRDPISFGVFYSESVDVDTSFSVNLFANRGPGEIGLYRSQFGVKIFDECYEITNMLPDDNCDNGLDELMEPY